jgi:hypothetical protein
MTWAMDERMASHVLLLVGPVEGVWGWEQGQERRWQENASLSPLVEVKSV